MFTEKELQHACKKFWTRYEKAKSFQDCRSAFERLQWATQLCCWGTDRPFAMYLARSLIRGPFQANLPRLGLWLSAWHPLEIPFVHELIFDACTQDPALFYTQVVSNTHVWHQWALVFLFPSRMCLSFQIQEALGMNISIACYIDDLRVEDLRKQYAFALALILTSRIRLFL